MTDDETQFLAEIHGAPATDAEKRIFEAGRAAGRAQKPSAFEERAFEALKVTLINEAREAGRMEERERCARHCCLVWNTCDQSIESRLAIDRVRERIEGGQQT